MQRRLGKAGAVLLVLAILLMACAPAAAPTPAPTTKPATTAASPTAAAPGVTPTAAAGAAAKPTEAAKPAATTPIKIGFLTPLVGVFGQTGGDMRDGFMLYLEQKGNTLAGRKVEVIVEDDEAKPDVGLTKAKKLVEKDGVNLLVGIVSSGVAATINDYVVAQKMPTIITNAGDDPTTQQKANPYVFRTSFAGSQVAHPLGDYAYKKGYRKAAIVGTDFAAGYQATGGFARVFTGLGGQITQELYYPLGTADMAPFISQIRKDIDVVHTFSAGADGLNFVKAYNEYGLHGKIPLMCNWCVEENILETEGDAALGVNMALPYVQTIDRPQSKTFVDAYTKKYNKPVVAQSEFAYTAGGLIDAALQATKGNVEDREAFVKALAQATFEAPRGTVKFDSYRNITQDVHITEVQRVNGKLTNIRVDTYPALSQFWKWTPEEYLKMPTYDTLKNKWAK